MIACSHFLSLFGIFSGFRGPYFDLSLMVQDTGWEPNGVQADPMFTSSIGGQRERERRRETESDRERDRERD